MARVRLIVTGMTELGALAHALGRVFPGHSFEAVAMVDDPPPLGPVPFPGFTTDPLPVARRRDPESGLEIDHAVDKIVQQLAAEVNDPRVAAVVVVDDSELANSGRVGSVLDFFRSAIDRHLALLNGNLRQTTKANLKAKGSFHLAVPMLESWFFADPNCLPGLPIPQGRTPQLVAGKDPEAFETSDSAYDAATEAGCTAWAAQTKEKRSGRRPEWTKPKYRRQEHPKRYLSWLFRDPSERNCSSYKETDQGVRALKTLDLLAAVHAPAHMQYLRSMLLDISNLLNFPLPALAGTPQVALPIPAPSATAGFRLRNI